MFDVSATDLELLDAWKDGDAAAGSLLLERYFQPLYRFFALKVGESAEDLLQETLYACVRHRERVRDGASFRGFLFAVARNQLYDHLARVRKTGNQDDAELQDIPAVLTSFSIAVLQRQQQLQLLHAIRKLPLEMQIAIELHYWEGLSTAELAHALEIPQGTVKSRLRRAKESLHAKLLETEAQPTVESTMTSLEDWAKNVRAQHGQRATEA